MIHELCKMYFFVLDSLGSSVIVTPSAMPCRVILTP